MKLIVLLGLYVILSVGGMLLVKIGASCTTGFSIKLLNHALNIQTIMGLFLYACSFLIWMTLIRGNDLSWIVPVGAGLVNLVTLIVALLVLNEEFSLTRIVGALIIIAGVVIINIRK